MSDPAEITEATVIRFLNCWSCEDMIVHNAFNRKVSQDHCVKKLGFLFGLVTPLYKFLNLFTTNLKKSYRVLNPQKVSVRFLLFS